MSVNRDVDAELRFHFDARIEELVGQGLSRDEAHARAVEEFGDVDAVRADLRAIDTRVARRRDRLEWIEGLWQDVVYAARSLRHAPAVSLTIILTLALGLGANAAMFSLLDVIYLRPPTGVVQPNAVRRVWERTKFTSSTMFWSGFDYSTYVAIAQAVADRAQTTIYRLPTARPLGRGENAPTAAVAGAAATYFAFLGVKPELGRFYSADEDRVDSPTPVAVVSDAFWHRQFDGDRGIVGRQITIARAKYTIIGVAQPDFSGTELTATDVWLPLAAAVAGQRSGAQPWWQNRNVNGFQVLLRLPADAAEGELASRITLAMRSPALNVKRDTIALASFGSILAANGPGQVTADYEVATRLAGVALIVLLIACANVINLLLARAVKRRREIAVRIALGVSRARLVRLIITESAMLAVVAAGGALLVAWWGGTALRRLLVPEVHFADSPLSYRVLGVALALALIAGAIAGLVPALQSIAPDLTSALKAGSRDGVARRSALRDGLVATQAAFSVLLLVGAVLFIRSLDNVRARDIGYSVDRLVFASLSYDTRDTARDNQLPARLRAISPRLASIAGVERIAFASTRPKFSISFTDYTPDFDPAGRTIPFGIFTAVSRGYFATIGMKLLRGRTFTADRGAGAPFEVVVNQAMADSLWPNQDPLVHCVHFEKPDAPCAAVVGVVETALETNLDEKPSPQFYVSVDHSPTQTWGGTDIIARVDPNRIVAAQRTLHDLLRDEFPGALPKLTTMEQVMEPEYRPWKLGATLFSLFGALALVVAAIGIYSSVSYAVSQRTHEFGIRLALGARLADVLGQVLGEGLRVVAIGVVMGILMALAAGRVVSALLYGIAPSDPVALSTVAALLVAVALFAAFVPAWRAARTDPAISLRSD